MRFIGSKERLRDHILEYIVRKVGDINGMTVADLFSGTATMSRLFREKGCSVIANDNLSFCATLARASLFAREDQGLFKKFVEYEGLNEGDVRDTDAYDLVLNYLNHIEPKQGFVFREYSPDGTEDAEFQRRYFSGSNASRIDAIRCQIGIWANRSLINSTEESLLLSSLIVATNRVANTSGTYGAFLRKWDKRALRRIRLERFYVPKIDWKEVHKVFQTDTLDLAPSVEADIAYLDPPYNWRHYGAYYHILETIVHGDEPLVTGKTGIRPWKHTASPFCYKDQAAEALDLLLSRLSCEHVFLSYNAEGLISHDEILDTMTKYGIVDYVDVQFQRYKSNSGGTGETRVKERLYYVQK